MDENIPLHAAFIMDGNGRWAAARGLPRKAGHEAGARAVRALIKNAGELGVKFITLYAFSTENWRRPPSEIKDLMRLLSKSLDEFGKTAGKNGARFLVSGRRDKLPPEVLEKIDKIIADTAGNKGLTVNLALNYGARQEIADAVNALISAGKKNVAEGDISAALYNPSVPDPDLIIRTSGEERLSNFLLWQAAYSEFYFTPVLWPDFDRAELEKALEIFAGRKRKFGNI